MYHLSLCLRTTKRRNEKERRSLRKGRLKARVIDRKGHQAIVLWTPISELEHNFFFVFYLKIKQKYYFKFLKQKYYLKINILNKIVETYILRNNILER